MRRTLRGCVRTYVWAGVVARIGLRWARPVWGAELWAVLCRGATVRRGSVKAVGSALLFGPAVSVRS
ncbi:hypothetical protein [Nocardia sp. NPDC004604]|uniref:hypothetical protein n=1 Tax=Nocardia sp. NPDC004604 TaxID=3157013 RepID=UPI00339F60E4